ncbi:MAG: FtsW/RodA/SpoVE family cell cycle protein [Planctomycetaceae bacterium]|nr:FtsW/RodA/SpoVE family cell cycle protein [Planctomycetaceae bacterium]
MFAPESSARSRSPRLFQWGLPVSVVGLLLLGLSGIARGDELVGNGTFAGRQLVWMLLSIPAITVALLVPYREWRRFAVPLFVLTLVLLVVVYFCPPRNGSRRWIPLGFMDVQPSELAKLAFILVLARYLMFRSSQRTVVGLIAPFLLTVIPVVLILREPDLGTSLLFFPVLFAMLIAAGARLTHLAAAFALGLLILPGLWSVMSVEQKSRVTAVFQQTDDGTIHTGDGYHLQQAKQMLALGGPWGSEVSGVALPDPEAYRLPASRTDFVICLIGERWGVPGTLLTLGLFALLIVCGLKIAAATRDPFGRLVAAGITSMLATQCVINTAMTVGLAPITGLTLPLVSYGGSSLMMTLFAIGLVGNIARHPGYDAGEEPFQFRRT